MWLVALENYRARLSSSGADAHYENGDFAEVTPPPVLAGACLDPIEELLLARVAPGSQNRPYVNFGPLVMRPIGIGADNLTGTVVQLDRDS